MSSSSYNNNTNNNTNRSNVGAWQPTAPTTTSAGRGTGAPSTPTPTGYTLPAYYGYYPQIPPHQQHHMPMMPPGVVRPSWQPQHPHMMQQQEQYGNMRGGVFYPAAQPTTALPVTTTTATSITSSITSTNTISQPSFVVAPRPKKPLVITDKKGNIIDLTAPSSKKESPPKQQQQQDDDDDTVTQEQASAAENEEKRKAEKEAAAAAAAAKASSLAAAAAKDVQDTVTVKQIRSMVITNKEGNVVDLTAKAKDEAAVAAAPKEEQAAASVAASSLANAIQDTVTVTNPVKQQQGKDQPKRRVYSKEELFRLRTAELLRDRPTDLPQMMILKGPARAKSGGDRRGSGRGGGGDDWQRGAAPRRQGEPVSTGQHQQQQQQPGQWSRGQAPPKQQNRRRSGRGGDHQQQQYYEGPYIPLIKSENHWRPSKNTSALVIAEKQVKAILNKMTKEKFAKLSTQMTDIPITSSEILNMMINTIYDKAIDEPSFGDIYADLCVRLSQSAQVSNFVHVIESDEEPPTEDGSPSSQQQQDSESSLHHTVYRWSNDISTSDAEVVGPLESVDACYDVALSEDEENPKPRDETLELELVTVSISRGIFVKVMKKKNAEEGEKDIYYTVYFPVVEAQECGQQLSEIFLSDVECKSDASKKNSFKRSLLNKCEEEFNKQDIYVDWKKEKEEYEKTKASLSESEQAEREEELDFRRIRIKKQMLGNVMFIGQLFKKGLLKERIMRFCIGSLLKLDEIKDSGKTPEYRDSGDIDMDEEDHEAVCNIFTTIGSTIETRAAATFMKVCFDKIEMLSNSLQLPSRSRFMYKDLLELRQNKWIPRRKEMKAKTLDEIRKDVEREERKQTQQAVRSGGRADYPSGSRATRGGGKGGDGDDTRSRQPVIRSRTTKPYNETDSEGFQTVGQKSNFTSKSPPKVLQQPRVPGVSTTQNYAALQEPSEAVKSAAEPLSPEKLERRVVSIRTDFIATGGNVEELVMSMDEISATPDAGVTLVSKYMDALHECKENERKAILDILIILLREKKLSSVDIQNGMADAIEFVDCSAMDAPLAYQYLGQVLGEMLKLKTIDMAYICEHCEKIEDKKGREKLIRETMLALRKSVGMDTIQSILNGSESLVSNLIGSEAWKSLSNSLK